MQNLIICLFNEGVLQIHRRFNIADGGELRLHIGFSLGHTRLVISISFPVGRVQFLDLFPMTFCEFLLAKGQSSMA